MEQIGSDPENLRKDCPEATIRQLADTIARDGLLQAITVRSDPSTSGRYLISYGERRFRAVQLLGWRTIAAVVNEDFDSYRQAIENLQREDLTPMQIAQFAAKREAQGDSRIDIARRLGKPRSFLSELAYLMEAPASIRSAFESARIDTRTAYLLARHYSDNPTKIEQWLADEAPITRHRVQREIQAPHGMKGVKLKRTLSFRARPTPKLAVMIDGQPATVLLHPGPEADQALVRFDDGTERVTPLKALSLIKWIRT